MTSNTGYCYWYYWVWILMSAVAWIGCIHEGWGDYFRAFLLLCNNQSPYLSKGFVYGYGFWLLLPCFLNQWEYYGICVIIGVIDWSLLGPVLTTKQLGFLLCLVGLGDLIAQNCMAILLLLTIIAWRSQKNHPYWAGLIMGFCLFKPSVVLILPFFCLKDQHIQWITCFGVMVGILGNYLPVVMFGQVFSFFDNILSAAGFSSSYLGCYESFVYIVFFFLMNQYPQQKLYRDCLWILGMGLMIMLPFVIWNWILIWQYWI